MSRDIAVANYGAWLGVLDDNHGMRAIAETIDSRINRVLVIYEKAL